MKSPLHWSEPSGRIDAHQFELAFDPAITAGDTENKPETDEQVTAPDWFPGDTEGGESLVEAAKHAATDDGHGHE